MKMVHGNAVFIREEAKLARNTHRYAFSTRDFTSCNSINFPEHARKSNDPSNRAADFGGRVEVRGGGGGGGSI